MQLSLKRPGDYSIRAMISVARHHWHGLRQARQIAAEMAIPYKVLTQILANLVAQGQLAVTTGDVVPGGQVWEVQKR